MKFKYQRIYPLDRCRDFYFRHKDAAKFHKYSVLQKPLWDKGKQITNIAAILSLSDKLVQMSFLLLTGLTTPTVVTMATLSALCIVGMTYLARKKNKERLVYDQLPTSAGDWSRLALLDKE